METEKNELEELAEEIRKTIADNRKFLERVMDDDFEPEEGDLDQGGEEVVEEL
jgi:hypothetical protein